MPTMLGAGDLELKGLPLGCSKYEMGTRPITVGLGLHKRLGKSWRRRVLSALGHWGDLRGKGLLSYEMTVRQEFLNA